MRTLLCLLIAASVAPAAMSPAEWTRHLLPLPKEVKFEGSVTVPPTAVAVDVRAPGDLCLAAGELLRQTLGAAPAGTPRFTIALRLGDATGRLAKLKNSDQAYAITPQGKSGLMLTAVTDRGLYYAAVTLAQLLQPTVTPEAVSIPLVQIVDWPDLSERGLWGGNSLSDVEWMSSVKMNVVESHFGASVTPEGHVTVAAKPELFRNAHLHALNLVPVVTHLDQLTSTGLYDRYPDCRGKGPKAPLANHPTVVAACCSHPDLHRFLAEWMSEYARWEHVDTVCLWLSENSVACGCPQCEPLGQFRAETRAAVRAWREAQKLKPGLKLRILLTQGSYKTNADVLDEAPPEVQISYYDGGRTYDSSRDPMIYPLLAEAAGKGRWLGCYPQLTASWRIVAPWCGPQFIKARMTEFVDKSLSNLTGYATPHNRLYDFNVSAAAEWGWNAHGRSERDFALAWATRRGVKDPALAADWAVLLGPVGWDLYGSRIPFPAYFGEAARLIKDRAKPYYGKSMLRYFPDARHIAANLETCRRATALAAQIGDPWIIAETQVISAFMTMLSELCSMADRISAPTPPSDAGRLALAQDLDEFATAGITLTRGLREWEAASAGGSGGSRLGDTIICVEETVSEVSRHLLPFGVRNRWVAYNTCLIGKYVDDDFEDKQAITKRYDVTPLLAGPGLYRVQFVHERGYNGINSKRVALASAPKNQPEQLTEIIADKHDGSIGYTPRGDIYELQVPAHDEQLSYFVIADIVGVKSSDKPTSRRGCQGLVRMWKVLAPGEEPPALPLLPMSENELKRYGGPKFTRGGIRVGVVQRGYGCEGLLTHLQSVGGLDAQPISALNADNLKHCQVLIVTQPYQAEAYTPQIISLLGGFVKSGGGVVALHDAVGYRQIAPLAPEVCMGGIAHTKDMTWQVAAEHPVTAGLPLKQPLKQSYYDFIVLGAGPAGQVVATGSDERLPVVVCGEAGKGRMVACGLGISINPVADGDVAPTAPEATLLHNAIKWCAEKR